MTYAEVNPQVSVSPSTGTNGTTFQQPGTGFTPNSTATLHFNGPDGPSTVNGKSTNGSGAYSHSWVCSLCPAGSYSYYAVDNTTGQTSSTVNFTVQQGALSPPTLTSPIGGATVPVPTDPALVPLRWDAVAGNAGYDVLVDGVTLLDITDNQYDASLPVGFHSWSVCTRSSSEVCGSYSTTENFTSALYVVDVEPLAVSLSSSSVASGGSLIVDWQVRNNGTGPAGTSTSQVRISASNSTYGNSSNNVGSPQATGSIGAGATINQNETVTAPVTPGTYYVWVIADNYSELTQTNVNNDFAVSTAFVVDGSAPGGFTLSNDLPEWDALPPAGPAVQLRWTSSNAATSYEVYRDGVLIFPLSGSYAETTFRNELGLAAGQTYEFHIIANNSTGVIQSNTISVGPMPGVQTTPSLNSASPNTITQGNSYQSISLAGSDFTASSWHQFSTDGGATWVPAQSPPGFSGSTSMTVGVSNTVVRTVRVRVCASFGSTACSSSELVTIEASQGEIAPLVSYAVPNAIPIGTGSQNVTLTGAAFVAANRYQESTDGGSTWTWAATVPTINSPTSMTIAVTDTLIGTLHIRVCSSQGSVACSSSRAVAVVAAAPLAPTVDEVTPDSVPEGAGRRKVALIGSDFVESNWHQFSVDGGVTWNWGTPEPVVADSTTIDIEVDNTSPGTLHIRVCSAWESVDCSIGVPLSITPAQESALLGANCLPSGCISSSTGAVVITHGWDSDANSWVKEMAYKICIQIGENLTVHLAVDDPAPANWITPVCSATTDGVRWDVWIADWRTEANGWGFDLTTPLGARRPKVVWQNAKVLGNELATYFEENHDYEYFHLLAHSAGSNLIDTATKKLKAATDAFIHETFLDAYDPDAEIPQSVHPSRHTSNYGKAADRVDNYVDTRSLVAWFGLADPTDLYLEAGFNIDVTPAQSSCPGTNDTLCRHSRPYHFYMKSIDQSYPGGTGDPILSTGSMGYELSKEAGSNMNVLSARETEECLMEENGDCTPVSWTPQTLAFLPEALLETTIDVTVGTVDILKDTAATLFDRLKLKTEDILFGGFSIAGALPPSSDDPAYIAITFETTAPVNVLRFDWAFEVAGQGVLHVYVDGDLVGQIDQRFVLPTSIETETISIGDATGELPPGAHHVAFRLDGFGANESEIDLTNVRFAYQQIADSGTYSVTPSAGTGGVVTPNLPQVVTSGGTTAFVVTPNTGFVLGSVGGTCPQGVWTTSSWTTGAILANCTVDFQFTSNDSDGDGVPDADDSAPTNQFACRDADVDTCDDCISGTDAPANDGTDTDADGLCNAGDADDDNDGLSDTTETNTGTYQSESDTGTDPLNPDSDGDGYTDGDEVSEGTNPNNGSLNPGVPIVTNGDFEAGNTAFTSGFNYASTIGTGGTYKIDSDPVNAHPSAFSYADHTSGAGLMLIANGPQVGMLSDFVWKQTVDVLPMVEYEFSVYVSNWANIGPSQVAELQLLVDGVPIGDVFFNPVPPAIWTLWTTTFTAGASSQVELQIYDHKVNNGNSFVLDDIVVRRPNWNSFSIDLELDLAQFASISDAGQLGLDITGDLSIEAWVKPESSGIDRAVVTKYDGDANERSFYFGIYDDEVRFLVSENGSGSSSQTASAADTPLTVDVWQHIAVTYHAGSGTAIHYLNGAHDGQSSAHKTAIADRDAPVAVGAAFDNGTPNHFYDGLIDDVRVWNQVRTGAEIAQERYMELDGSEIGLAAYWRFNADLQGETANQNDLTDAGTPGYSEDAILVPEPSRWLSLLLGGGLMSLLARRQRARGVS